METDQPLVVETLITLAILEGATPDEGQLLVAYIGGWLQRYLETLSEKYRDAIFKPFAVEVIPIPLPDPILSV
ncbi:hypothetical protein EDC14_101482 [Hydrogenispora ethanolica]|jgi:hypothetical protein|uniref:Uncharacterized protein n=1 Tax=Hydrogenispora ethanolica TaxID=1082276 RepID=A0A4R1RMA2_HYDET|nr:hypothetical protein [Hydrogenispora ethanolica]TCL67393.1 hypothetical protein EDC14_101482 [Hydrogenispora ethanolica]